MIRHASSSCVILLSIALAATAHCQAVKLDYASYIGGSADEWGYAVTTDSTGAVYIAGFTDSYDFPVLNAVQRSYGGGTGDLFIAKLKSDGSGFAYITYLGGSGGEGDIAGYVGGIAVDAYGNAFVAGVTRSSDFPTTPGAFQTSIASKFVCDNDPNAGLCGDAFILKLSAAGDRLLYSTYLGGSDYDDAKAIAIDATGAAYVTGITASSDFPTTGGAYQTQLHDVDAYVAKLSPDGSRLLYSTVIGGTGLDAGMAIAVDPQGRAYVAGTTQAPDFPLKNALQASFAGSWDAFVSRLNAAGSSLDFSTLLGGQGSDEALSIALDMNGDIHLAGLTASADFPVKNAFQPQFGGGAGNGFVTKIRGNGSAIIYSTFLGGADGGAQLNAIAVNAAGNAYVAGQGGLDFPVVNSLLPYGGASDIVIAKLTTDGSGLLFSTFVGGSGLDLASGIAFDPSGRVVITGQTSSLDFPLSANSFQSHLDGASDAFILRLIESPIGGPIFSSAKLIPIGETYVGQTSAPRSLIISNRGNASLAVTAISATSNVQITSNCATVVPSAKCSITASLLAAALGDQSGSITIFDNAPDSPQTIFVRGTAVNGGDLEVASLVTGSSFSYYGRTAVPVTATIFNHGPNDSNDVIVSTTSASGSASCNPCYIGTVKAGSAAIARFNFLPSGFGMIPLTVQVAASDSTPDLNPANNSRVISVANPRYAISPSPLSFNNQIVYLSSPAQAITISSLDQKALKLSFSTTGDFHATSACDPGFLRCYAYVMFLPTSTGVRNGTLVVTEAVAGTVQQISLSGTGILAPHVKLSATELNFTGEITGVLSTPQALTVTNDGSAPLFVVSISVVGNFVQSNRCPASLAPSASCSISVSLLANQSGASSGTLTLVHNASEIFDVVTLSGTAFPLLTPLRPSRPSSSPSTSSFSNPPTPLATMNSGTMVGHPSRPIAVRSTDGRRLD